MRYPHVDAAADALRDAGFGDHDAVVVLGSGWQSAAAAFGEPAIAVPIGSLPGFHAPIAEGHGHEVRSYAIEGRRVLVFLGRTHLYEGYGPVAVAHGVRVAASLGCRTAILTNANGSFRSEWTPGSCMVIRDHLNLTATSPLLGATFIDLTDAYSPRLRAIAHKLRDDLVEGVYAMLPGPHYETWAEGRMLVGFGADAVGMSTVLETIAAREAGLEVLALSLVTVTEGGDEIDPSEVVATASRAAAELGPAIVGIIAEL